MRWEIRLANQAPIVVEVEVARNLAAEWDEVSQAPTRWWHRWFGGPVNFWRVTEDVVLHKDMVAGVLPVKARKRGAETVIAGFLHEP